MQKAPLPDILTRCIEQVEYRREGDNEQNRPQSAHDQFGGNARNADDNGQKCDNQRVGYRPFRKEEQHDERDRQHNLDAGIESVHGAVAGEKLTDGDILEHQRAPPFALQARRASSACCTV